MRPSELGDTIRRWLLRSGTGWPAAVRNVRRNGWWLVPALAVIPVLLAGVMIAGSGDRREDPERSVVRIIFVGPKSIGSASGVVVAAGGYVVTNHHAVKSAEAEPGTKIRVFPEGIGAKGFDATVVSVSPEQDLALLRADGLTSPPAILDPADLAKDTGIRAIGFPLPGDAIDKRADAIFVATRSSGTVGRVIVADWSGSGRKLEIVQHSAPIQRGSSGGPLVNACGGVVAINMAFATDGSLPRAPTGAPPPPPTAANAVFFGSHARELVRFLETARVTPAVAAAPCRPAAAGAFRPIEIAGLLAAAVALAALAFAPVRRATARVLHGAFADLAAVMARRRRIESVDRRGQARPDPQPRATPKPQPRAQPASAAAPDLSPRDFDRLLVPRVARGPAPPLSLSCRQAATPAGILLGRDATTGGIATASPHVSRRHARFVFRVEPRPAWLVEDLGSRNGTRVNGQRIQPNVRTPIFAGDSIQVGDIVYDMSRATSQRANG